MNETVGKERKCFAYFVWLLCGCWRPNRDGRREREKDLREVEVAKSFPFD